MRKSLCGAGGVPGAPRPSAADVTRDHRPCGLDPPQEEGEDEDDPRGGPEGEGGAVPVKAADLLVHLDPVDAMGVLPARPRSLLGPLLVAVLPAAPRPPA